MKKQPKPVIELEDDEPEQSQPEVRTDDAAYAELVGPKVEQPERHIPETRWRLEKPLPEIDRIDLVITGAKHCNICGDEGRVYRRLIEETMSGEATGASKFEYISCPCRKYKAYKYLISKLPPHDQHIRLDTLAPSPKSCMPEYLQVEKIAEVKANPDKNWCMFGPARWSKSTFSIAMYERAVKIQLEKCFKKFGRNIIEAIDQGHFPVWWVSASTLIDATQAYHYDDGPEPVVTVNKVNRAKANGWKPRLFVEEIDKIGTLTKDRMKHLWDIITAVFNNGGQLVFTSNLTPEQFEAEFGSDIYGRAMDDGAGVLLDLFDYVDNVPKN